MIRYKKFLKEAIIKKRMIGHGAEGSVYPSILQPDKVIKQFYPHFDNKQIEQNIKNTHIFLSKHPDFFVKIYRIHPKYVVMERLNTRLGWDKAKKFINDMGINVRNWDPSLPPKDKKIWNAFMLDLAWGIDRSFELNSFALYQKILAKAEESKNEPIKKLIIDTYNFISRLYKKFPNVVDKFDIHSRNLGRDKQGNIKAFDILPL